MISLWFGLLYVFNLFEGENGSIYESNFSHSEHRFSSFRYNEIAITCIDADCFFFGIFTNEHLICGLEKKNAVVGISFIRFKATIRSAAQKNMTNVMLQLDL